MSALYVSFKVADTTYVVRAADVLHMESFTGVTFVPGAARHVAGLVQTRGRVIPLLDLRLRFGLPPAAPTIDTRIVIVQRGARAVGLRVDSAREVLHIADEQLVPPPDAIADNTGGYIDCIAQTSKGLVLRIELERILGDEPAIQEAQHGH